MQDRACPRCRSQRSWIYNSNRLMYPMIQKGERGDLSTFERVTWEEANQIRLEITSKKGEM